MTADATPAPDPLDVLAKALCNQSEGEHVWEAALVEKPVNDVHAHSLRLFIEAWRNNARFALDALGAAGLQVVPAAATWYTDEIERQHRENVRLRAALQRIADEDYRGPRPWSATYAYEALAHDGVADLLAALGHPGARVTIDPAAEIGRLRGVTADRYEPAMRGSVQIIGPLGELLYRRVSP